MKLRLLVILVLVVVATGGATRTGCVPVEPAAEVCTDDAACTVCTFATAPKSQADCYCPFCPTTPLTATECEANAAAHQRFCSFEAWPGRLECPIPRCLAPEPVVCDGGTCALLPAPVACTTDDECVSCTFGTAPEALEDCYCPMCPHAPMTRAECEANTAAFDRHCGPDVFPADPMGCPIPMCLPPRPLACVDGACVPAETDPLR